MTKREDGGPAFPITHADTPDHHQGMTLRDHFAGQAIHMLMNIESRIGPFETITDEARARRAYQIADAMLAERAK